MTITVPDQDPEVLSHAGRSRKRLWVVTAVAVVVTAALAITAVMWVRHYRSAPGLDFDGGGLGWNGADGHGSQDLTIGDFSILRAEVRPYHAQSFDVWVHNPSSVTETILGLTYPGSETSEPSHILVSRTDPDRLRGADQPTFTSAPVAVPPNEYRIVRYVLRSNVCWTAGRSETFTALYLRVRVGAFTRNETVGLGDDTGFVLTAKRKTC